ncbi:MAG TPA: hypothetical protein VK935_19180, partial [Actinomycetospora sp.]|nr:hypothetical protein [Actinomycetospora sp.]
MAVPHEPLRIAGASTEGATDHPTDHPTDRPELDPALRDRVQRFVGVLRRVALARSRPVRHTRHHVGELALVDVGDQGAIRRPQDAGDEILRVPAAQRATFDPLFDLMRAAADQPEAVELVLAGGLLHAPDHDVRVHLLTRPVRIEHSGDAMVVTLAGDAARWEDDELLEGTGLVDEAAPLPAAPASPLDEDLVGVLAAWADARLRVEHERGDDWIGPTGAGTWLVPAPAIVARRRGAAALRAYYDAMVADLAGSGASVRPLPVGLAQLVAAVEPADRAAWLARTGHDATPVTDPLFPLPVGAAQGRILSRLGRDSGVVVEGPPGTGKTHTIANLLCALLAEGRRVLVTSEKAQALRVLRDKLPPEMRDLCISLAEGPDDGADREFGAGIAGLAARSTEFDPDEADRVITELTERRAELRTDRDAALDA